MRLRWPGTVALALVLAFAMPATAQYDLNKEEREIIAWSQPANPALTFEGSLLRLLAAEDAARRVLLLERCPVRVWSSPVRFANPKYDAVMREFGRAADKLFSQGVEDKDLLPNAWSVGAIETWRTWNASQRQAWLAFMRTTEAKRGSDWYWTMAAFDAFHESAIDWNTGRPNPMWPAWAREFLAQAGLSAKLRDAANAVETGLGDRFAAESARTVVYPVDETQQQVISELVSRMKQHWRAISQVLRASTPPDAASAAQSWSNHPQVREIEVLLSEKRTKRARETSASLMSNYTRETELLVILSSVMGRTLRPAAAEACRLLQQ